jgi:Protein of unknown function (DUF2808)
MNKLICTTALSLAISSSLTTAWASNPNDAKMSHLGNSAATPSDAVASDATHKFDVYVQGKAISELAVNLPKGVSINRGIEVKNKSGEKIPATVSIKEGKATLVFSQPVAPGTTILVSMKGVNTPSYGSNSHTWLYEVSAKKVDMNGEISLGLAQVQTYPL